MFSPNRVQKALTFKMFLYEELWGKIINGSWGSHRRLLTLRIVHRVRWWRKECVLRAPPNRQWRRIWDISTISIYNWGSHARLTLPCDADSSEFRKFDFPCQLRLVWSRSPRSRSSFCDTPSHRLRQEPGASKGTTPAPIWGTENWGLSEMETYTCTM